MFINNYQYIKNMVWTITDNYLFLNNKNNIKKNKKIFMFDLDNTIITTTSGKVFPVDEYDWKFIYDSVEDKINLLSKNHNTIGIITNQMGLKNNFLIKKWITKINNILKKINIDFVFVALKNDGYRKPLIKSLDILADNGIIIENYSSKYYIGDACGRPLDHTDTDLKFALNAKLRFRTPEKFFNINTDNNQELFITYPELDYYTVEKFVMITNNIIKLINNNEKVLILIIGFPACGKSYLRNLLLEKINNLYYFNNDDIKDGVVNPSLCSNLTDCYSKNKLINDNTNLSTKGRNIFLDKFNDYYKIGIFFDYDMEISQYLNYYRMYYHNKPLINKMIYNKLNKDFVKPNKNDFNKYFVINKIFPNFKSEIKYLF
jgi:bifunctional polynucleotide phosphatase/kinase